MGALFFFKNKMKHGTYELLRRAYLGDVDADSLRSLDEDDPFVQNAVQHILRNKYVEVPWDRAPFTADFRNAVPERSRLDETVVTFLLLAVGSVKDEMYVRTFQKPESFPALMTWEAILRRLIYAVLALAYRIESWTPEHHWALDHCLLEMLRTGKAAPLRDFMEKSLGIRIAQAAPFRAEQMFEKLSYLHVGQFGSFYWRLLHWMAEAVQTRPGLASAKRAWRELTVGPLYRTLRCPVCMIHLKRFVEDLKPKMLDESIDFPRLWFDVHNRVHQSRRDMFANLEEPDYKESEYREDAEFMRRALLAAVVGAQQPRSTPAGT